MTLITAKEAKELTSQNIRNNFFDKILYKIKGSAKDGQYGVKVRFDSLPADEIKHIESKLLELGYEVEVVTQRYSGSLKEFTDITINWYNG